MKVFKFGGASVKDAEGIKNLVDIVRRENNDLVVVVSAMGKTTNALEQVAENGYKNNTSAALMQLNDIREYHFSVIRQLFPIGHTFLQNKIEALLQQIAELLQTASKPADYDEYYDQIVSFGELISTRIVSVVLNRYGLGNVWLDMTKLLSTDATFRDAKVDMLLSENKLKNFLKTHPANLYIAQGFIGGTEVSGEKHLRTTLGREGSDYSAAIIANILQAESVTIWKDVPGILNADPRLFTETQLIPRLSYYDAVELAYSGAQVIHPKTIRPIENKRIPLYVKPFLQPKAEGTVICETTERITDIPVFIWRKKQILITIRPKDFSFVLEDSLNHIFEVIHRHHLKVSLIQSSAVTVSVCVDESHHVENMLQELRQNYSVTFNSGLSLLTIRGTTPDIVEMHTHNKEILLTQTTRRTAKFVIKEEC